MADLPHHKVYRFYREGKIGDGTQCEKKKQQRVVIRRDSVDAQKTAFPAPVHDRPLAPAV
jgi:hypothetical protein